MIRARDKKTGKILEGEAAIRGLSLQTATRLLEALKPERASMNHKN